MKTKLFLLLVLAGIVLAGCSSTQDTTSSSDSDSIANMQDTIIPDTTGMDTTNMDTSGRDTAGRDTTSNLQ